MKSEFDKTLDKMMIMMAIIIVVCGTLAVGTYMNTRTYNGYVVTGQEPNGPFGGKFYEVSCSGTSFHGIAGGTKYACARIGDTVQITTYSGWYADSITGDNNC